MFINIVIHLTKPHCNIKKEVAQMKLGTSVDTRDFSNSWIEIDVFHMFSKAFNTSLALDIFIPPALLEDVDIFETLPPAPSIVIAICWARLSALAANSNNAVLCWTMLLTAS